MDKLCILHLSDLHYDKAHEHNLSIIRNALFNDLKTLREQEQIKPNCVIFSGDLIFNGNDGYSDTKNFYIDVKSFFIDPLLTLLEISSDYFFITPGNHDVQRENIDEYLEEGLKQKLVGLEEVDILIEGINSREDILKRLENFNRFKKEYGNNNRLLMNNLFTTYTFIIDTYKIGIGCLNSAWRSYGGDKDYGELLLGRRQCELVAESLKDCNFKIAVIHHPLEYLKDFERISLKLLLYTDFDILLFGHLHAADPELIETLENKRLINRCGSLFQGRSGYNGYSIIILDLIGKTGEVLIRQYYDQNRYFNKNLTRFPEGKVNFSLENKDIKFQTTDLSIIGKINKSIKDIVFNKKLLTSTFSTLAPKDLELIFVEPPLSLLPEYEYKARSSVDKTKFLRFKEIIDSGENVVFLGESETGRSTILDYICLKYLETDSLSHIKIPFLIDFCYLPKGMRIMHKAMQEFALNFGINIDLEEKLTNGNCVLLIDNFDFTKKRDVELIKRFVSDYPNNRYILTATENIFNKLKKEETFDIGMEYKKVYLHSFKRKHARLLIKNWFINIDVDIDKILDKIIRHITAMNVPCTPMIISLFLSIYEKQENYVPINKSTLVEKFIGYWLEKLNLTEIKSEEMDYRNKEDFLMYIVRRMTEKNEYFFTVQEFEKETFTYFEKRGFTTSIFPFINNFLNKGIFVQSEEKIYFRFKCFCEFFIAKAMMEDKNFYDYIVDKDNYLQFVNEIDYMTGLERKNRDLITLIADRTRECFEPINQHLDVNLFNKIKLNQSILTHVDKNQLIGDLRTTEMTDEEMDDLLDDDQKDTKNQQVEKRKDHQVNRLDTAANLILYSKLIKNCELIDDVNFKKKNLKDCLTFYSTVNLLGIVLAEEILNKSENNTEDMDKIDYFAKVFIPLIFQQLILYELGTNKLAKIIEDEIENSDNIIFVRLLLVSLYADLKLPSYLDKIKCFLKNIDNRYYFEIILYKLITYYIFRKLNSTEKKEIENIISDLYLRTSSTGSRRDNEKEKNRFISNLREKRIRSTDQLDLL